MYNISLQKPEVWRAFKQQEYERFVAEEKAFNDRMEQQQTHTFAGIEDRAGDLSGVVAPNQQIVGEAIQQDFVEVSPLKRRNWKGYATRPCGTTLTQLAPASRQQ